MGLYLSPYIGTGAKLNPFRPTGLDQPGASAVDMRLDPTRADGNGIGFALLWLPSGMPDPVGAIKIADDYGEPLPALIRNRLNTRTGLDFSADTTIQDAIETIMLRPDTGLWKRLRPCRGMYEVWLGSSTGKRKWVDLPAIGGGSISDSFTRADETPIAAPWTELSGSTGDVNLSSNGIVHVTTVGELFLYYNNPSGWNADQSSQWQYVTTVSDSDWGPAVRIGSNNFSGYWYSLYTPGGTDKGPKKLVNGTFTSIEAGYSGVTTGQSVKIDVAGSTIRCYNNGSEDASSPATDSSLTTAGNGAGIFFYELIGAIDDALLTGEITGGGGGGGGAKNLPLLGVGMVRLAALARMKDPVDRRTLAKLLGVIVGGPK